MKLAVIGSRNFSKWDLLEKTLDELKSEITCVISGGARGADSMGERWAIVNDIKTLIFPAEWDKYGKEAGFIRNRLIINEADYVVAFWDGKSTGTAHSIGLAEDKGIPVKIVKF